MKRNIKDYLHLYLGCQCKFKGQELKGKINQEDLWKLFSVTLMDDGLMGNLFALGCTNSLKAEKIYPMLRPLSSMTEQEADYFAWLVMDNPHLKEESYRIDKNEIQAEIAVNDGSNMLDDNVELCIGVSCRCYEGFICFYKDGSIALLDEDGKHERPLHDIADKINWLRSKYFDCDSLIESGLAIDKTIKS